MEILEINLHIKRIRAEVIRKHLHSIGTNKCVCFTCGNARDCLEKVGLNVVGVGNKERLIPGHWFSYSEIQDAFGRFDATSGHLPLPIMEEIAKELRAFIKKNDWVKPGHEYLIPTGSGESIVLMYMAFPDVKFFPIRYNKPETEYNKEAPLNNLVYALTGWSVKYQKKQAIEEHNVIHCIPRLRDGC